MDKEDLHLKDLFTGSVMEKVDKTIKYIQKNAGAISLMSTAIIALGSVVIKFIYYLNDLGYTHYFGISKDLIDVSNGNIIYSFFADGVIALFWVLLNFGSYQIWQEHKRWWHKILHILILTVGFPVVVLIIPAILEYKNDHYRILVMLIALIIIFLMVFSLSFYWIFIKFVSNILNNKSKKKDKNTQNKKAQKLKKEQKKRKSEKKQYNWKLIGVVIFVVLESLFIILIGWMKGKNLNEFKILENLYGESDYAVIYETSDSFIITECEINKVKQTISFKDLDTKKEIDKKNVEYSVKKLV